MKSSPNLGTILLHASAVLALWMAATITCAGASRKKDAMYQLYLVNTHSTPIANVPLRKQTINWICTLCNLTDAKKWYIKWIDKDERFTAQSKVYQTLQDWPNQWAVRNGMDVSDCYEAPLPGGDFFRILAADIDAYACNPQMGYSG